MSVSDASTGAQMQPSLAWTVVTDAPLKGLGLMREAGRIITWDEVDGLVMSDLNGDRIWAVRAPGGIQAGAVSDDGSLVALLGESRRLWLFGSELELIADRETVADPLAIAVDPHGRFVAVSSRMDQTHLYTRFGRKAGEFETMQPLAHLVFVPGQPRLLGAAGHGSLFGMDLYPSGRGKLFAEVAWRESLLSNVGRLAVTGDGGTIIASCYIHGIQRFDAKGRSEGAYHLGGTAVNAVPDFIGRTLAAATQEGELFLLNRAGNVRWKTALPRPAVALEIDALGRWLVYGQATGEVSRIDLDESSRPAASERQSPAARSAVRPSPAARSAVRPSPAAASPMRTPAWSLTATESEDRAETAVLAVLDDPPRIGLMTSNDRLELFTITGKSLGKTPPIAGNGRLLRTASGWIAAATDRELLLFDARRNAGRRLEDLNLVQLTHLQIRPDDFGLAAVQERDRLGRATTAGRWIWRKELPSAVEELAIGPDGLTAVTTDDGRLLVFDPAGNPVKGPDTSFEEPLGLASAPEGASSELAFLTLARHRQILRGHDERGWVLWESPVPWESWQLERVGTAVVVSAPDGRAIAYDGTGRALIQGRDVVAPGIFSIGAEGEVLRISRRGPHLICDDLSGRVRWRALTDSPRGPLAAGRSGVALLIGRNLAWFPHAGTASDAGDP
ncbi:PQQ-binding-like beta-propeller repeat protein [Tautonia rosea]|uniref:PQQ-binding-like beta-propeller repeat protein n=1 Tax=Tautonia rosea TaxID=2728037 RepID=UPI001474C133|nr:PQQ-binding-like beta-propeller repeat protein [Tautonia rosea]